MQWLIDIIAEKVINEIGIPPVFINRGDPTPADFEETDLTQDNNWHELDLSGIIPENAKGVIIASVLLAQQASSSFQLRRAGNVNNNAVSGSVTQVANQVMLQTFTVPLSDDRKLEYNAEAANWFVLNLTVTAWIF